jgi:hypothetical protein
MNPAIQELREFTARETDGSYITVSINETRAILELIDRLSEDLTDMVAQNCAAADRSLDSFAISSNADAMRLLAELGKIEITHDRGRRVIARWPKP